ncbi:MAG TPA: aldo/keto reductase [Puia sp.]|jgi:aryl-alcohol dehydrogenase-like predicted oxidoreductase|nr:aldo/keto reductase [Puia sp.]
MIRVKLRLVPTYKKDTFGSDFPGHGSRLVCGTSGLGGIWGKIDEQESIDCMLYALGNGITSFDTSPSYSNAEELLGKALAQWKGSKPFVSTKVGRLRSDTAFDARLDYSYEGMRESILRSLELLGLETVDLLFIHEPQWVPIGKIDEILEILLSFKEAGYARMLGVGGNPSESFLPFIDNRYFQVVSTFTKMDACNLSAFEDILPITLPRGIRIYAASSLHFGLLGNRFDRFVSEGNRGYEDNISEKDIEKAVLVNDLASRNGMALPEMAQRYLFSMEEATRIVMGARKIGQVTDTIDCWKAGALSKGLFDAITGVILGD